MKRCASMLLAALLLTSCHGSEPAPTAVKPLAAPVATCAVAEGTVEVLRAGQAFWEPVRTGSLFRGGDWVRTGRGAYARIERVAGGNIELSENAVVIVEAPKVEPGSLRTLASLSVREGQVRGTWQRSQGESSIPLLVELPNGQNVTLAPHAGTTALSYRLTGTDGGVEVAVTEGAAALKLNGQERDLRAGQSSSVTNGVAAAAVELIDFPTSVEPGIDSRFFFKPKLPVELVWKPVPGAISYHVQIGRDLGFQSILESFEVNQTHYTFTPPSAGLYTWHVASRDMEGRVGEFGFARRIFCEAQPPVELLLSPADGAAFLSSQKPAPVVFQWQSSAQAQTYRLVLSHEADLRTPVVNLVSTGQRSEVNGLPFGDYYWGIYIQETGQPIFLKPRRLALTRVTKSRVRAPKAINSWGQ